MSGLDLTSAKKKRKRGEMMFKFKMFGEQGHPVNWSSVFLDNVKALLEFGQVESNLWGGTMSSWSFQLEIHRHSRPDHVLLFVVEESVESSLERHCKHCQYVGWGHHMICNKKYHFLVPSKDTAMAYLSCINMKGNNSSSEERADSRKPKSKPNLLELQGHILHGIFHSNGFGHLLSVNGLETGLGLPGYQIMDFWDRLCSGLKARKVSLNDIAQKKSMELRLIHGIAYGQPWFGRWGYRFGRGTYGVTQPMYQKAMEAMQSLPLSLLLHHLDRSSHHISTIISRHQMLSGQSLSTLGDLLHFMLELKFRLPKQIATGTYKPAGIPVETSCRWSPKRVEMATRVIVETLKRAEFRWVSRQEVRDAARTYIGDTGLLDFVLKSLGNRVVGNYLVRRSLNPVTKVLEYSLEHVSTSFLTQEGLPFLPTDSNTMTRALLTKDVFYLYKHVFQEQQNPIVRAIGMASRIILDAKYFVKEYYEDLHSISNAKVTSESYIYCTVVLGNKNSQSNGADERLKGEMAPYERFTIRNTTTFDELKVRVEKRFREIYWVLRGFVATIAPNLNARGSDFVFRQVEVGGKVVFEGEGINLEEDVFEGGGEDTKWVVVDCACGAKEVDGERTVSCDVCEVWQHSRCVGIADNQEIPTIFLCGRCEQGILLFPCLP
ncbi:hypothetical protein U1Q18_001874 [Sarracenia purpurea var. burkii]